MTTNKRERIDALGDEIALCAARIDSATHQLLTHIRHFDELKGWAAQGAKGCAAWLCWRIGGGRGAAREKVRVARALGELPHIDAALAAGQLSYCKVRAMTRVATPANETLLLEQARGASGAQLEKICAGLRSVELRMRRRPPERFARRRHTADGMVRIEVQLQPDEAALVWQALGETKRRLRAAANREDVSAATPSVAARENVSAETPSLADAAVAMAEQTLAATEVHAARAGAARRQLFIHLREDKLQGGLRAELHDGTALSGETLLRIACDSGIVAVKTDAAGNPLDVGRRRRTPPAALMRALRLRDRHCAFPSCGCETYLEAHHVEHWAQCGETSLANTVLLCWRCHGLVHEGGFSMRRIDDQVCFFAPDGRLIEPAPRAPALDDNALAALTVVAIDRCTSLPDWDGRPLDLQAAVGALLWRGDAMERAQRLVERSDRHVEPPT
jgi:hypothetical protein